MKYRGKLHADDSCADNGQTSGLFLQLQQFCTGYYPWVSTYIVNRGKLSLTACRNNNMPGSDGVIIAAPLSGRWPKNTTIIPYRD